MRSRQSFARSFATFLGLVLVVLAIVATSAQAQTSPATDQYGTRVAGIQVADESVTQTAPASDALPNTGLSLLGTAVAGGILVVTGLAVRRREKRNR